MPRAQRGIALGLLLIALIVMVVAFGARVYSAGASRRDAATTRALAEARRQLLATALGRQPIGVGGGNNDNRPGSLPCPDLNAPGSADAGRSGLAGNVSCNGSPDTNRLGRLPSRTMVQPVLRDGSGEPLWYALVRGLDDRDDSPLNNDFVPEGGKPWFSLWLDAGRVTATSPDDPVVAVVIAPGAALAGQPRDTAAQQRNPANYLETATTAQGRFSNRDLQLARFLDGPVPGANGVAVLNDRVLAIRRSDLLVPAARRAAREYQQLLALWAEQKGGGRWPNPADPASAECTESTGNATSNGCAPDAARCRGRLPKSVALTDELQSKAAYRPIGTSAADWSARLSVYHWLYRNRWEQQFFYAVGTGASHDAPAGCAASLTVHGVPLPPGATVQGVMFGAGPPRDDTQPPQRRVSPLEKSRLANYLDPLPPPDASLNVQGWDQPPLRPDEYAKSVGNDEMYLLVKSNGATDWIHAD
ncbi:hypothetical protein [Jeongeupia naejangsanensis]|uniref:Uncharacterized protein n=1 Tax=Jeongeupia naejangsanensis TaxID=613195 RepID=A0ABS2BK31_9NEIS|nr:hypothetical protein [Jeongeupia naejangsanensis]MBM3115959.1 hypothetical protein [Jeongeupia naejangsanensis]